MIPSATAHVEKFLFIRDLKPGDIVRSTFLVKSRDLMASKNGKPYLTLLLGDKSGDIDTRVWERADELVNTFQEGDVVAVGGRAHSFQGRLQLVLDHIVRLEPLEVLWEDFLPQSSQDTEALYGELVQIFRGLENPWVRTLSLSLLEDPEIASRYKRCPAAKTIHHAFIGGLLSHSLQLVKLAEVTLPFYPGINRDLVLFGCAFHDFGKIYELSYEGRFGYTDEGRLVGHIAIATTLVDRKIQTMPGFPHELELHLKHLILSHHGKLEYGSPKTPQTLEAELVHWLDHMDSRLNSIQSHIDADANPGRWTSFHKTYENYFLKPSKSETLSSP